MNEQIERLTESCQEFINALYDILEDMVDKLSDIFVKACTAHSGAIGNECENMSEYEYWLAEKKWKEHLAREFFEMQMKHTKTSKGHKFILMNRKFAPRSWTGKNYKKGG